MYCHHVNARAYLYPNEGVVSRNDDAVSVVAEAACAGDLQCGPFGESVGEPHKGRWEGLSRARTGRRGRREVAAEEWKSALKL